MKEQELRKKIIERHQLDLFKGLFPEFPRGEITSSEEPDFLVSCPEFTLGIEITELHCKSSPGTVPLQATEAMRRRVSKLALEIYKKQGGAPIRCNVHMDHAHIQKNEVNSIATSIAECALKNTPPPNSSVELQVSCDVSLRDYLIVIHRADFIDKHDFNCPGATWLPQLSSEDIARVLRSKETKQSAYRAKCDIIWLLIVADYGAMSTWFDISEAPSFPPIPTGFDKIFLLSGFRNTVYDLSIQR